MKYIVAILILLELTLQFREFKNRYYGLKTVAILILLELTLQFLGVDKMYRCVKVAILILLELTLQSKLRNLNSSHQMTSQSLFYWN